MAFGGASFILDIAWRRVYERTCRHELHMSPEAQEQIERKIGQSLARSRLTRLTT
jgi:Mn-dependent DtxR family transcriptional regulator